MSCKVLKWFQIFLVFSVVPFFFMNNTHTPDAIVFSWGVILLALVICIYHVWFQKNITISKQSVWVAVILTVLFLLMLSLEAIVKSPLFDQKLLTQTYSTYFCVMYRLWAWLIYLPCLCLGTWLCIYSFVNYFIHFRGEMKNTYSNPNYLFRICWGCIIAWSAVNLFSTFPGIFVNDDVAGIWNYITIGFWDDWHPFAYLLFIKFCSFFYNSSFSVNVCQTILWILFQYYVLRVLKDVNVRCMLLYTGILCVATTPFTYLEVMYKDTPFSMGFFVVMVVLIRVIQKNDMTLWDTIVLNGAALLVTLFRHTGEITIFLTCAAAIFYFRRNRRILFRFVVTLLVQLVCFVFIYMILFQSFQVRANKSYVKYGTPMAMIGAAVQDGMTFEEEDVAELEKVMPLEEWGTSYNKYLADSISREWGAIGMRINTVEDLIHNEDYGSFLLKMNLKILLRNPVLYARAILDMNSIIWEIGLPADADDLSMCQSEQSEAIQYTAYFKVTDLWSRFLDDMPITHSLFQRGGFSLFMIISIIVIWILRGGSRYLLAMIPLILYNVMLFITIPAQDPRYALPMIECAIYMVALLPGLNNIQKYPQ